MQNFFRILLFFLFFGLSFTTARGEDFKEDQASKTQELEHIKSPSFLSEGKIYKSFCLQPAVRQLVSAGSTFPVANVKDLSAGSVAAEFAVDLKIHHVASQYILNSRHISRSLSIREIIFPFHYFW